MPPQLNDSYFSSPPNDSDKDGKSSTSSTSSSSSGQDELAATSQYGRSSTLIQAQSDFVSHPLPFHWKVVANGLALLVPSLFYIGPILLTSPFVIAWFRPLLALQVAIIVLVLAIYPHQPWPAVSQYFQLWYGLYNLHHNLVLPSSTSTSDTLDSQDPSTTSTTTKNQHSPLMEDTSLCIYATHPHGIIPIHGYLWSALCQQHFPQRYGFCALTDIALHLPLLRQLMSWLSSDRASKSVLLHRLQKKGQNLYILPGGVAEIFLSCPGRHIIKTPRRGLMKLALETGAVLIPTYVFGANAFHHQLATYGLELEDSDAQQQQQQQDSTSSSSTTKTTTRTRTRTTRLSKTICQIQQAISRKCRGGFTVFWGQYGLPLPLQPSKCCMVFGDPIESVVGTLGQGTVPATSSDPAGGIHCSQKQTCRIISHPTDAEIDELWHRYTNALIKLFDQYKDQAGYPNAKLELV